MHTQNTRLHLFVSSLTQSWSPRRGRIGRTISCCATRFGDSLPARQYPPSNVDQAAKFDTESYVK